MSSRARTPLLMTWKNVSTGSTLISAKLACLFVCVEGRRGGEGGVERGGGNCWLVVCLACCPAGCSVMGSILLCGFFPVEGIFPMELTWVLTPFPQNSFG